MRSRARIVAVLVCAAVIAGGIACRGKSAPKGTEEQAARPGAAGAKRDLPEVAASETLTVIAEFNSTSYFLYHGEPMGFEYEALKAFAADHQLQLRTVVATNRDSMFAMLRRGEGDVVAARLAPTARDSALVAFTRPLYYTPPVLVQRNPPTPGTRPVQTSRDLAGARVQVPSESPYQHVLLELADTVTGAIGVVKVDSSSEALIRAVSNGAVGYTVSDSNLAKLTAASFPNIIVRPVLGEPNPIAWAVRRDAPRLRAELDHWLDDKEQTLIASIYRRYFDDVNGYRERMTSPYLTSETGQLSQYDQILQRYAKTINWDWRLLASQAYQESHFKPTARSHVGAEGLLQLMPGTAKDLGVRNRRDPEQNVRGAVKFLSDLTNYWAEKVPDPAERLKFILASYNAGAGHVEDARRLAEKHGGNPQSWPDVAQWLLQAGHKDVQSDPAVRHGFVRGEEPVRYVSVIFERFQHYLQAPSRVTQTTSAGEVATPSAAPSAAPSAPPSAAPSAAAPAPEAPRAAAPKPGRILERKAPGRLVPRARKPGRPSMPRRGAKREQQPPPIKVPDVKIPVVPT